MAEDPHAAAPEEDPEQHLGPVIPDPWADDEQTDWPTETVQVRSQPEFWPDWAT
jgi:hypothetical protein